MLTAASGSDALGLRTTARINQPTRAGMKAKTANASEKPRSQMTALIPGEVVAVAPTDRLKLPSISDDRVTESSRKKQCGIY